MDKKKILIIDDEEDIRRLLKECLELEGYAVQTAEDAAEAEEKLGDNPDLILLDVTMPKTDGFSFCGKIRDRIETPILFLSARTTQEDKIKGLKAGGDDYMTKPFGMEELLARVEAHLRREERKTDGRKCAAVEGITMDFCGYRVLRDGTDLELTKMEFQIAELLFTNKGQVFTKEKIYETVRGYDGEADAGVITEHIRRMRRKLGTWEGKEYIETVWGVGYKWIG